MKVLAMVLIIILSILYNWKTFKEQDSINVYCVSV